MDRKLDAARRRLAASVSESDNSSSAVGASSADASSSTSTKATSSKLSADDAAALRSELATLEQDRIYIKYYPKDKKYISLFNPLDEKTAARRVRMRSLAIEAHAAFHAAQRDKAGQKRALPRSGGDEEEDDDNSSRSSDSSDSEDAEAGGGGSDDEEDEDAFFLADEKASEEDESKKKEETGATQGKTKKAKKSAS